MFVISKKIVFDKNDFAIIDASIYFSFMSKNSRKYVSNQSIQLIVSIHPMMCLPSLIILISSKNLWI